jgi:predicted DCC family thiol-disulfide oxidoreductase YuxK
MKRLYVLYDQECALCQKCRWWLMRQPAFIELCFIPFQSPEIDWRFPGLKQWDRLDLREKLVVISDGGALYQGQYAWIMCLYALRDYREWSQRLAHPTLLPFARRACEWISKNRLSISRLLQEPADVLKPKLSAMASVECQENGRCHV